MVMRIETIHISNDQDLFLHPNITPCDQTLPKQDTGMAVQASRGHPRVHPWEISVVILTV